MKNLRDLAKVYVDKYPGNERAASVHSQIEGWIDTQQCPPAEGRHRGTHGMAKNAVTALFLPHAFF